ncbi:MAG: ABC transporter permease [Lachnospiraceae bacterium]|nr:ABC transporter permease [Lachnospiraceae bacterium]
MMNDKFVVVGRLERPDQTVTKNVPWYKEHPVVAEMMLVILFSGCFLGIPFLPKDPTFMDILKYGIAPGKEFFFGTDTMGRDIFSMIWYGGRVSLSIGMLATVISTAIAIVVGAVSGLAGEKADTLIMRLTEILLAIPNLLMVIFLQAILGKPNPITISVVIGVTSWMSMAKVVRTEVRQLRNSEYILAARMMGGNFFYVLWHHLTPNFISSIMFMVVMQVRSAIVAESTLSFMGIGLPLEIISWGSMLSLSEKALLSGNWWIIVFPGVFLVGTLLCITEVGNYIRKRVSVGDSML